MSYRAPLVHLQQFGGMMDEVLCPMAQATISVSLCEEEQGASECEGCRAPSRRCTVCHQTQGIAEPKKGLCAHCLKSRQGASASQRSGAISSLDDIVGALRGIGLKPLALPPAPVLQKAAVALSGNQMSADFVVNPECLSALPAKDAPHERLIQALAAYYGVSLDVLLGESREQPVARIRQIAAYCLRKHLGLTYPQIAKIINRDHSTVMFACSKIAVARVKDSGLAAQLQVLEDSFQLHLGKPAMTDSEKVGPDSLATRVAERAERAKQSRLDRIIARNVAEPKPSLPIGPALLQHPEKLCALIQEHAILREDGSWRVKAPLQVLRIRAKLTSEEAASALAELAKRELVTGSEPWSEVGIPAALMQKRVEVQASDSGEEMDMEPRPTPLPDAQLLQAAERQTVASPPPHQTTLSASPRRSAWRPQPQAQTVGEIYAGLLARSSVVSGERVVRGAIPLLQVQAKIGPGDAVSVLERLLRDGHVAQKDGWRTIVLLAEKLESGEPAVAERPTAPRASISSSRQSPAFPKERHLRVVAVVGSTPPPTQMKESGTPATVDTLDSAIASLEEQLPSLRGLRDEVAQRVATLEASLAGLRAARDQYCDAEAATSRLLRETEAATSELLSTLRRGGS